MKTITKADGGSKSENVRHLIPICYRNGESGKLEITDVGYDGLLEAKTMRRVNKLFLEKAGSGYFYPLEPLDAYHDVWLELERKAAHLPELTKATPHTYLSGVARLLFLNWFKRKVEPARQMYRQVEDRHYGKKGAVGIDDFDIDNYDGTEATPSSRMTASTDRGENERLYEQDDLSAHGLGEHLSGDTATHMRQANAARQLEELYATLENAAETTCVRAFRAYVAANGNFPEAAVLAGIPKTTYYRKWPAWITAAREAGERTIL